jgi:fumarate hydratase class II
MNCNEVIANLANVSLGGKLGEYTPIHPNDHVNMAQSTNDVFPTAIRIATLLLLRELSPQLDALAAAFEDRGNAFADVIKSGRTHLQDAVPLTLGQEFRAYASATRRATRLLLAAADELRVLGIGGTAVGTGMNAPRGYRRIVVRRLNELTNLELIPSDDLREAMQSQLPVAAVSGALRNLALELTRITNDLRLLASGPQTGLAEIILPSVQPGSSIMPGKVNPTQCEAMTQVCTQIFGNHATITFADSQGHFELNVYNPVMAYNFLQSVRLMADASVSFTDNCVVGIEPRLDNIKAGVERSLMLVTALAPKVGYDNAAKIAKIALKNGTTLREEALKTGLVTAEEFDRIVRPEDMIHPN